uniref:Transmembrane protein n=1 Tax=Heterorhabditis bacteriophora TaxID=37862 RepID=A0A1I7WRB8_HETBA
MMETLAVEHDADSDTLRRTIQRNRVKPIQQLVMENMVSHTHYSLFYDASKYRRVSDHGHLLLKDDDNMIIVASGSLLNHIFVVLNLVNLFGDGRFKQIPKEVQGTGSSQLYTVMTEENGGYCLLIFFAFIQCIWISSLQFIALFYNLFYNKFDFLKYYNRSSSSRHATLARTVLQGLRTL